MTRLSSNEVLLHALANLGNDDPEREGGYAVRHAQVPVFDLSDCSAESAVDNLHEQI